MLNATHYFIMKNPNEKELQPKKNHSFDIDFKLKLHREYTKELYSFLVNHMTLSSDNPLWLRKNLL